MPTAAYIMQFRKLKKIYCDEYGSVISDVTWYRLSSQIRRFLNADFTKSDSEVIVRTIASLKKRHRNFRINSEGFSEAIKLFSYYKGLNKKMTCAEFIQDLSERIDIFKVSRASRYVWFESSGIPFRLETEYHTNEFAFVAFRASKSVRNNHRSSAKAASEIMDMKRKPESDQSELHN